MNDIGDRIRAARKKHGWLQQELADRVGVSRQIASNWERGYTPPDTDGVAKIAAVLGISVEYLLYGKELDGASPVKKIALALEEDGELLVFFKQLADREDLKDLFRQAQNLQPDSIRRIIKYIKIVEDEESK